MSRSDLLVISYWQEDGRFVIFNGGCQGRVAVSADVSGNMQTLMTGDKQVLAANSEILYGKSLFCFVPFSSHDRNWTLDEA